MDFVVFCVCRDMSGRDARDQELRQQTWSSAAHEPRTALMNLWATRESSKDVSQDYSSNLEKEGAINALIKAINSYLQKIETGEWKKWRVIFMIASAEHQAALGMRKTRRLTRRNMTLDFRVFVDYTASKTADFNTCVDLLTPALERTLPFFRRSGLARACKRRSERLFTLPSKKPRLHVKRNTEA